jgi:glycosyltransferase involved in cell wall biosynthesis
MKILYVGHTYTVRANQAKIAALARLPNTEITLVTPHAWRGPLYNNDAEPFDTTIANNVKHEIIKAYFIGRESGYFYGPSIFRLIARLKPDIVHVEQGAYALSYSQILLGLQLFSRRSKALFFTWWNLPYRPKGIKQILERFNLARSSAAIAGNMAASEILQSHGFSYPVHVLPQLGIDTSDSSRSFLRKGSGVVSRDIFSIGYAGRIVEEKGVFDLIEAAALMKGKDGVQLYFIGAGDKLEESKRLAAYRGVNLLHHPSVRNDELPEHLLMMDVLVLPSHTTPSWVEQFGHVLLEAMAMGVPVVGSSSGEIPNVIGNAGYVFPEGDSIALAEKLDVLFASEEERQRLSNMGVNHVLKHYTHDIIATKQMRIYEEMLKDCL